MSNILITGGCGAIGINLVKSLLQDNYNVVVLDNLSSGRREWLPSNTKLIIGDIRDQETLDRVFSRRKIEYVIHLAANFANQNSVENPILDAESNIIGSIRLLKAMVEYGVKNVVYTSSSCVYGSSLGRTDESQIGELDTPYAISKYNAEFYFKYFSHTYNINSKVLRLFNSYGPYELSGVYRNVIPKFIDSALKHQPIVITGTGEEMRDFTYVGDTVEAIKLAMKHNARNNYDIFNVGNGQPTKIIDLAKTIIKHSGSKSTLEYQDRRSWDHVTYRECNNEKIKDILNWQSVTSLSEGLIKYIAWYKSNNI